MKLYLVRHGETVFNSQGINHSSSSELSESGKKQAEDLAKRLQNIDIDIILASSQIRAKQTAEIIARTTSKSIEVSDYLCENENEDSLDVLVARSKKAIELIHNQTAENVLVVSHGTFIRVLLGSMVFGENFNAKIGQQLVNSFHTHNSGITMLEKINDKWRLLTWNDYAHLG